MQKHAKSKEIYVSICMYGSHFILVYENDIQIGTK